MFYFIHFQEQSFLKVAVLLNPSFVVLFLALHTECLCSIVFFRLAIYRAMLWLYFWYHTKFIPHYLLFLRIKTKNLIYLLDLSSARWEKKIQQWPFISSNPKHTWRHSLFPHTHNTECLADKLLQTASSWFRPLSYGHFCCIFLDSLELLPWNWRGMIFLYSASPSLPWFYNPSCHISAFIWFIWTFNHILCLFLFSSQQYPNQSFILSKEASPCLQYFCSFYFTTLLLFLLWQLLMEKSDLCRMAKMWGHHGFM